MTIKEFEKAIDALGVHGMSIRDFRTPNGWDVRQAYAWIVPLTWIMWDDVGRAFRFVQPENEENCITDDVLPFLDYSRDKDFDLTF